jgi:hypothetical protein
MAAPAFKEAIGLLGKMPALWVPGLVAGLLGAGLSLLVFTGDTFFAGRLLIIFGLVLTLFIAGALGLIRNGDGSTVTLVREGIRCYFRVLLPLIVIVFTVTLVIVFFMMGFTLAVGGTPDIGEF